MRTVLYNINFMTMLAMSLAVGIQEPQLEPKRGVGEVEEVLDGALCERDGLEQHAETLF